MTSTNRARSFFGIFVSSAALTVILSGTAAADEISVPVSGTPARTEAPASSTVISTPAPAARPDRITGEYVKEYFTDTGAMLVSPARWDRYDWLKAGLVLGATSGLYFADTDIRNFAQRNQSSIGDKGANLGNALGNPLYVLPPLGLFYLYGHFQEDPKARQTSLLAVESLIISGAFTWTLKEIAQRPRPYTGESSTTWYGPNRKPADYSFPSGHSTVAFSVASVIAEEYGNNPYVPPIAYGLATLTAFSRIYSNEHWASDVFLGGAIGYFVGKAVVRYHTQSGTSPVTILPTVSQHGLGLMAEYRF